MLQLEGRRHENGSTPLEKTFHDQKQIIVDRKPNHPTQKGRTHYENSFCLLIPRRIKNCLLINRKDITTSAKTDAEHTFQVPIYLNRKKERGKNSSRC